MESAGRVRIRDQGVYSILSYLFGNFIHWNISIPFVTFFARFSSDFDRMRSKKSD